MGFLDSIGTVLDRVVPTVIGFATGGPIGAAKAGVGVEMAKRNEKRMETSGMFNDFTERQMGTFQNNPTPSYTGNRTSFFGDLGSTIGNFGRDVSGFVQDLAPALNLFGVGSNLQRTNAGAAQTIDMGRPQETSTSGEILGANLGMGGALVSAGRQLFRSPGGQTALGFGAGAIGSALMGGPDGKVRITRRMKSDVRKIYMMAGMDPNATAQILNNLGTYPRMNFDASLVFFILTKRFRNDGPVVTKAAVRKTKTTLRRMKGVVDMYNSVCKPTAPRRRAAPSRAKAVQLISNK
jgi:hypothetical protein